MPILALVLANLPAIMKAGEAVYDFLREIRTAANQSKEWTEDHEKQFRDYLVQLADAPEQQPDAPAPLKTAN